MIFDRQNLDHNMLVTLYKKLLFTRIVEEKMQSLARYGTIEKWVPGIGGEAIAVGSTLALSSDDYILTTNNVGVFLTRDVPFVRLMGQWQGKPSGYSKGRDTSLGIGLQHYKIIGSSSHLQAPASVANGIALADKLNGKQQVTLVFVDECATSRGDFHEALNIAAVWNLPVIFLVENNSASVSTPNEEQYRCEQLVDKAIGYGMEGRHIDGNNVLEVYNAISDIAKEIRQHPRPVLLECVTFKLPQYEEGNAATITQEMLDHWQAKDPVKNYEKFLLPEVLSLEWISYLKSEFNIQVDAEVGRVLNEPGIQSTPEDELKDVYRQHALPPNLPSKNPLIIKRYGDAISDALNLSMSKHNNLVLLGQDIAGIKGGKIIDSLLEKHGKNRIKIKPDCEPGILGTAMGLALNGYKAVVEMPTADCMSSSFSHVVHNLAKTHYRWGQNVDVVVRMPVGSGIGAGPFHSQTNEAWFTKTPGLKVVYPAFPVDAKGLLMAAIDDPNPVIFFEHKYLYENLTGQLPEGENYIEIGKARIVKKGDWATIITYGMGVHWALEYLTDHPDYSIEIIDLRSLQPWDKETVEQSIKKTSRVLILHEDTLTTGFGAEIAAHITQHWFTLLDAPVMRCASLDTPVPANKGLEAQYFAKARLEKAMDDLLTF